MKLFNPFQSSSFEGLRSRLTLAFKDFAHPVEAATWQGVDVSKKREARTHELMNCHFMVPLNGVNSLDHWAKDIKPNLPWANDHFEERVGGAPINPGVEWANWPWGGNAEKFLLPSGKFNHNYMERYWPKQAGKTWSPSKTREEFQEEYHRRSLGHMLGMVNRGIRWEYGDLNDVVHLLVKDPTTRQAWLPVWFPEDTGIGDGGRKPCTIGYHFMMRDEKLFIHYAIRSCDFHRHMQDDIYLTIRLALWIIDQASKIDESGVWPHVTLESFSMWVGSLHMFENDMLQLRNKVLKP